MQLEIKWTTTTYDRITDVITRLPFNIDGNWWKSGDISFSCAFDKDKRCNMLLASKYIFAQRTDYINDAMQQNPQSSLVLKLRLSEYFKLCSGKYKFRVKLNGKVL